MMKTMMKGIACSLALLMIPCSVVPARAAPITAQPLTEQEVNGFTPELDPTVAEITGGGGEDTGLLGLVGMVGGAWACYALYKEVADD